MKTVNVAVKPSIGSSILHLYKELEAGNMFDKSDGLRNQNGYNFGKINKHDKIYKKHCLQLASFQRTTKWLIILGQTIGLMPVLGVLRDPPAPVRFKIVSLKVVYGLVMFTSQALISVINFLRMFETNVSVTSVGNLSFYVASATTTFLFFQVAKKWPSLVWELPHYQLDEYIDSRLKVKCNIFIMLFLAVAIAEHVLAEFSGIAIVLDCAEDYTRLYRDYIELCFPWIAEFRLPDHFLVGVTIQFINITATLAWNYSDIFIVCISYYLTSILQGIKRKLIDNKNKLQYFSSNFWVSVREDYSHAAQLVRAFDDVVSGVLFTSFASNLFFICFQLYNLLSNGMRHKIAVVKCPRTGSGPLGGYETVIYLSYSMAFVLLRYLCVSLITARVHTTSQSLAPVLYGVPSPAYNIEVQRFLDQIHHETVALSGLQFFYVTKSLVLTVAGAIFTYELVLLQYGG